MGLNVCDSDNNKPDMTVHDYQSLDDMDKKQLKSPLRQKLEKWLNKNMKIEMTDGRVLVGIFLCTDRDRNVILGSCAEYLKQENDEAVEEPRVLGLAMVPGHHIISIHVDSDASCNPEDAL